MKKIVAVLALAVLAAGAFAAGTEEAASDVQKVVWWTSSLQTEYRPAIQELFLDPLQEAHPEVELELVYMEDYYRTTQTAIQAGAGPDIIQLGGPGYALEYWSAGQLSDMSDLAAHYGWESRLLGWAYESGTSSDGSLITLPMHYETLLLFYNETLFEKHGLQPPQDRADVERVCNVADEEDLICFSHYVARNRWQFPAMWGGYAGHDRFYAASIQEMRWDHPLLVEAMEYWNSQVQAGWWGGDLETYYSMGYADANSALMEGDALMMINGTWVTESLISMEAESGNHWNFVQTPPLRDGVEPVYELSIGESIALSASAEHRDAAGTVLNFLFEDTTRAAKIAESTRFSSWFPPLHYKEADFGSDIDPRITRWISEFSLETGRGKTGYPVWGYWPPQSKTWAEQEIVKVHNGDMTAADFMAAFQEVYAADYAEAGMPIPPAPNTRSP